MMIEAVKKAEDSNAIIIRLYETSGRTVETNLQVKIPFSDAAMVDLMEQ